MACWRQVSRSAYPLTHRGGYTVDRSKRFSKKNLRFISKARLTRKSYFLGNRSVIPDFQDYDDICVLSSHYEGLGLAVLKGMAAGKPCIASNLDGVKEIVDGYGLLFERVDSQALVNHILKLYNDKVYYKEVAEKCLQRSKEF